MSRFNFAVIRIYDIHEYYSEDRTGGFRVVSHCLYADEAFAIAKALRDLVADQISSYDYNVIKYQDTHKGIFGYVDSNETIQYAVVELNDDNRELYMEP